MSFLTICLAVNYIEDMIELSIRRSELRGSSTGRVDRDYWLSRPADERLAAVEFLRRQYYGRSAAGLRRVVSVSKR